MEAKFSDAVKEVISLSREEAIRVGNDFIGTEHLILGAYAQGENGAVNLLNDLGVNKEELTLSIEKSLQEIGRKDKDVPVTGSVPLTKQCEKVLKITYLEAKIFRSEVIGVVHILLSTTRDEDNIASQALAKFGINYEVLRDKIELDVKKYNDYEIAENNENKEESESAENELVKILQHSSIRLSDAFEAAIGINDLAAEASALLINLNVLERGKMVGVFGNWGRGKTFLMNRIWDEVVKNSSSYIRVNFNAWKYQDAQASWAYLYESLSESYFKSDSKYKISNWLNRILKIIKLNVARNGFYDIALFMLSITLIAIGIVLMVSFKPLVFSSDGLVFKGLRLASFVIPLSIGLVTFIKSEIVKSYGSAAQVFNSYYKKASLANFLGVQAEVEKEIKALLSVWLKNDERIILMVDDIDRCSEDKVISTIDSFRIMLDDLEISQKVIVVAAIDEKILLLSVKKKYADLLDKDLLLKSNLSEYNSYCTKMAREYLDKLFIAGVKLGKLSSEDKQELFHIFTKGQVHSVDKVDSDKTKAVANLGMEDSNGDSVKLADRNDAAIMGTKKSKNLDYYKNYELDTFEYNFIKSLLGDFSDSITPRQIKIYYYRYLMARNLLFKKHDSFQSETELNSVRELLADLLLQRCFRLGGNIDEWCERKPVKNLARRFNYECAVINGNEYTLPSELIGTVIKVSDIVVGY